jgi:hypothetical protein
MDVDFWQEILFWSESFKRSNFICVVPFFPVYSSVDRLHIGWLKWRAWATLDCCCSWSSEDRLYGDTKLEIDVNKQSRLDSTQQRLSPVKGWSAFVDFEFLHISNQFLTLRKARLDTSFCLPVAFVSKRGLSFTILRCWNVIQTDNNI